MKNGKNGIRKTEKQNHEKQKNGKQKNGKQKNGIMEMKTEINATRFQ